MKFHVNQVGALVLPRRQQKERRVRAAISRPKSRTNSREYRMEEQGGGERAAVDPRQVGWPGGKAVRIEEESWED